MRAVVLLLTLLFAAPAAAFIGPDEILPDPAEEARARAITAELRCVVCQGQALDESEAPIARDLRLIVREQIVAGRSDDEIFAFLTDRYGEYVLYRPPFTATNAALWLAGPVLLLVGGAVAFDLSAVARRHPPMDHPSTRMNAGACRGSWKTDRGARAVVLELYYHPLSSCCMKALVGPSLAFTSLAPLSSRSSSILATQPLATGSPRSGCRFASRSSATPRAGGQSRNRAWWWNMRTPSLAAHSCRGSPGAAAEVRMWDRIFDGYIQSPMQKIVSDALRPDGARDAHGVEEARRQLAASCAFLESRLGGSWAAGGDFSLADCSAAPALFYADTVQPFGPDQPRLRGYLGWLCARPSFARALAEAEPFFGNFPLDPKPSRQPGS